MKRIYLLVVLILAVAMTACSKYSYEKYSGDDTKTRIYTLSNGLKVYLSQNHDEPKVSTIIAVRVGSKNDPIETTGLAHYFEHLMFKGTKQFGTSDYEKEEPLLDEIEALFEVYRTKTDPAERKAIYAKIDSVSQEAAKYFIPNEYDKLMSAIGSEGTNAWTSYDETCYVETIPANQIENWAMIESDRFQNAVIRGFHTELETVYEEYNMGLTSDIRKAFEKVLSLCFPDHAYGMHSVIGFQDHLKNPSITNIKNYFKTYYVPNNIAICMSGDFEFDSTIAIIDKYFGQIAPNENLPEVEEYTPRKFTEIKSAEVLGLESPMVIVAWPTEGVRSKDATVAEVAQNILSNGKCGLVDTDINYAQKTLGASSFNETLCDAGATMLLGMPKEGQTLEEVRDLLLAEVEKLRNGEFDEELLSSIVANLKRTKMNEAESASAVAHIQCSYFINGLDWSDYVESIEKTSKVTKEDVVRWAQENLPLDAYAVVYKREGVDTNIKKIEKPQITPIPTNRDLHSEYLESVQQKEVKPIEPLFLDFDKDMTVTKMNGNIDVLYKKNETNKLFSLIYLFDTGREQNPVLNFASDYIVYLGTENKTSEELKRELYEIACDVNLSVSSDRTYMVVSGLDENMEKAMAIAESYFTCLKGNDDVLAQLKGDAIRERMNSKTNQRACFSRLVNYVTYGPELIKASVLSNEALMKLTSEELLSEISKLASCQHQVLYYGPRKMGEVVKTLNKDHFVADELIPLVRIKKQKRAYNESSVVLAHYDAKQIYYNQYSCKESDLLPFEKRGICSVYNNYFGGSMNAIVFQEMREARGLAYSANANFSAPLDPGILNSYSAFIATQNDKMAQAIEAFDEIIEDMPVSEPAFDLAKSSMIASIASQRTTKEQVLWSYVSMKDWGLEGDFYKDLYKQLESVTLEDVVKFQQENVKGRKYVYSILGDEKDLDMNYLHKLGPVKIVSLEEIFGY